MSNKKILIITNLFPSRQEPARGIFNKQQFIVLANSCELKVVAPVPRHKSSRIRSMESIDGIETHHPAYFITPKIFRSLYGFFFFLGIIGTIRDIQKQFDFDCILATWAYPDGFAAALLAKLLKKPLVIKVHGSDINLYTKTLIRRHLIRYALNASDKIVAVTEALKLSIRDLGIPVSKIEVIPNGVDNELFKSMDRKECNKKIGLENGHKVILFVGNLVPVKGVQYLVEAFAELPDKRYSVSLTVIGDGPQKKSLKDRARALVVDDITKFVGRKPHDEMPLWINSADILCLPSINEGCPNVVLEAMACGKPVVASAVGGLREIISTEDLGILVKPGDPKALAEALIKALDKTWDPEKIRKEALKFTWKESAEKLKKTLDDSAEIYSNKDSRGALQSWFKAIVSAIAPKKVILWRKPGSKGIALTFDDGPNRKFTPRVLEILKDRNIKATFFLVGKEIEQNKELAGRILSEGHSVGMHSYSHYKFGALSASSKKAEIARSKDVLRKEIGINTKLFRPPQGVVSLSQLLYCLKNGITTVMWSINSMDYLNKGPENIKKRFAGNGIRGGDVILFHDDNEPMLQVLPEILDGLKEKNFSFVTIEELLK